MQVYKEGIERTIKDSDWADYQRKGYIKVTKIEPQPKQEEVQIVDDYTVKPKKKKVAKKGV